MAVGHYCTPWTSVAIGCTSTSLQRMVQGLRPLHLKHLTLAATPFHLAAISQLVNFQGQLKSLDVGYQLSA